MTAAGRVPPLWWALLAGNLFWVLAYDTESAMVDRDALGRCGRAGADAARREGHGKGGLGLGLGFRGLGL